MASAGTVTVDFAAETAKFTTELKKVRSELSAVRKDTSLVSNAVRSAGNYLKAFVGLGAAATAIRAATQATSEAEQAQALLNNALEAAGAPVKSASADFAAYAQQLQRTTTFSDEAIMQVETLLLSFRGLSGDTVKRATASVLDLSTRMGIDAPAAAKLLGKALADPEKGISQLARAGVVFTDQQKQQIKTLVDSGAAMKAQEVILQQLQQTFGGAAAAARNTFGGALAGLRNQFGELLEGKGGIGEASGAINALSKTLSSPEIQSAFATLIQGLAKFIELSAKAASVIPRIATGIGEGVARLTGANVPIDFLDADEVAVKLQGLQLQLENISKNSPNWANDPGTRAFVASIDEQIAKLKEHAAALKSIVPGAAPAAAKGPGFVTGGVPEDAPEDIGTDKAEKIGFDALPPAAKRFLEQVNARLKEERDMLDEIAAGAESASQAVNERVAGDLDQLSADMRAQQEADLQAEIQNYDAAAQARVEIEQDAQDRIHAMRQGAVGAGIGLLQLLAQKSKTAAKALILINKGLAIAQVVQNTAAAVMATIASNGGMPWAAPQVAAVKAIGATQIGLIAATGALEIANVGAGGGSSIGGATAPVNRAEQDAPGDQQRGAAPQTSVQVHITGVVTSEVLEELWDGLSELANGRDKVMFSVGSRQVQEIREG